jgi:hypothetical protein
MAFVVKQASDDVQILYLIKNTLGFGQVIIQSKSQRIHRYVINDLVNIQLICLIFQNNMVFPIRAAKFQAFLSNINIKLLKKNISPLENSTTTLLPTLTDH